MEINLSGMSADALTKLAERASALAADLRKQQPSYELALEAGVKDTGYPTVANGYVNRYEGEALVEMANGKKWKCVGHRPKGSPSHISKQGYIEFIPLGEAAPDLFGVAEMVLATAEMPAELTEAARAAIAKAGGES